ncbi:MAG: restriction endonuclease subunit S [Bacteroidetes bacterium]|nr:restriction endonuclease subunit S [Bacteroidota bacterium]
MDVTSKIGDGLHGTPNYDNFGDYYFINGNNLNQGKIVVKPETQKVNKFEYLKHCKPLSDNTILVGINGTIGNVAIYKNEKCILGKSACFINVNEKVLRKYFYYVILNKDFQNFLTGIATGTTIPNVPLKGLREYTFKLPPLPEQTATAEILTSLDDKIELLHRQNKTLEQIAETLFHQWFIEEVDEGWVREPLGSYVTIKRGGSPRPIHDYISVNGLNWLKISDVTGVDSPFIFEIKEKIKVEGLNKTTFLKKGSLVLSNSATPGIPKILDVDSCIHDGWLHFPKSKFSNEFLYLFFKNIKPELLQLGNGSIFTNLKTDILKEYVLAIPDDKALKVFDAQIKTIFKKLYTNTTQIRTLTQLRDALLPKLMSGEIRVKDLYES